MGNFTVDNHIVKALGVNFNINTDSFEFIRPKLNIEEYLTKREVLSFISSFYDPFGFSGPMIATAILLMKKLWLIDLKWDDILPNN